MTLRLALAVSGVVHRIPLVHDALEGLLKVLPRLLGLRLRIIQHASVRSLAVHARLTGHMSLIILEFLNIWIADWLVARHAGKASIELRAAL